MRDANVVPSSCRVRNVYDFGEVNIGELEVPNARAFASCRGRDSYDLRQGSRRCKRQRRGDCNQAHCIS